MSIIKKSKSVDVTRRNPIEFLYIKGNESTDGSIRLRPDEINPDNALLELRTAGVWNTTGLVIAGDTLSLGREASISALGEFIVGFDAGVNKKALHSHIHFSDAGTLETGYFANLQPIINNLPVQTDDSTDIIASLIEQSFTATATFIITLDNLKVGSVVPIGNIILDVYRTIDAEPETLFYREAYPQALFDEPSGTEITLILNPPQQISVGQAIRAEIYTDDGSDFSLLGDATDNPWFTTSVQVLSEEPILTFTTASSKMLSTLDGTTVFDQTGGAMFINVIFE